MAHDLDQVYEILRKKEKDYAAYQFKANETMAIFAFFDLTQEFATITNLYRTAVAVIKFFFGCETCIYTIRPEDEALMLQCCTAEGLLDSPISRSVLASGTYSLTYGSRLPLEGPLLH